MWRKLNGAFEANVQIKGDKLIIDDLMSQNYGTYACMTHLDDRLYFENFEINATILNSRDQFDLPNAFIFLNNNNKQSLRFESDVKLVCITDGKKHKQKISLNFKF